MVTEESLQALDAHWAVKALRQEIRDRAFEVAKARYVKFAISDQVSVDFLEEPSDTYTIDRTATAYEIAAAEAMNALLNPTGDNGHLQKQAEAAAYRIYELRRALPIPQEIEPRIFHILHLSAVAYCADRWAEQRRWLSEHAGTLSAEVADNTPWDLRLLYRIYDCWIRLIRKNGWDDLSGVAEIIGHLRREQDRYETELLKAAEEEGRSREVAYRLVALYNWARATELLSSYVLQGEPVAVNQELDQHFEDAREAALASGDLAFDVLLRWLHVASRKMVSGSIWTVARMVNSRVTRYVESVTRRGAMFELLPPQRVAIQREGLLDPAKRAVVVELPTSGGKTALALFRILQALNQFDAENGWVAYVAPTRALVSQLTRRLRKDLSPLGIVVEQLSGAVEVDAFEDTLLNSSQDVPPFHVLVSTPEKLQFVIRNKKTPRPLALLVVDEAHNIEDEERGLRIELLLATVKRDCPTASFLLLMPFVPNAKDLATWLGSDAGASISLSTTVWKPNERIVGMFWIDKGPNRGDWTLKYEALTTTARTIHLRGTHRVGGVRPLPIRASDVTLTLQTGAMAKVMSERGGTSIAVARTIRDVWSMARVVAQSLPPAEVCEEIELVKKFLAEEISPQFELIGMLDKGVGVHHAGLSEEVRALIEWLAETNKLRVLCATSTIAQGINFPVSSVFLATLSLADKRSKDMTPRAFWNLAGRAGRVDQGSLGVVGIASGDHPEKVRKFVSQSTGELISRLETMLDELYRAGRLHDLEVVIRSDQWGDFRSYIAHLWNEKRSLDAVLAEAEQVLRNTFGYSRLRQYRQDAVEERDIADLKARRLLEATKNYARHLAGHPENAVLADSTGFAPEGVREAILGLDRLDRKLSPKDWMPDSLFGQTGILRDLVGVMMNVPELRGAMENLVTSGMGHKQIASLMQSWVHGESLESIAIKFFKGSPNDTEKLTSALSDACRGIYRYLTNFGSWGVASLSKMPTSGLDFASLTEEEKRKINLLPAMIYYGVRTPEAILMRMHCVPRSVAQILGNAFTARGGAVDQPDSLRQARSFLETLSDSEWNELCGAKKHLSGTGYRRIWKLLSGT